MTENAGERQTTSRADWDELRMKALGAARTWALIGLDCDRGVAHEATVVANVDAIVTAARQQDAALAAAEAARLDAERLLAEAGEKADWVWMPHAAHLIVGHECRFHLATKVGEYIVSTVGEWWPDREVRRIHAETRGIAIEGRGDAWDRDYQNKCGWMEIGAGRIYETMVFRAIPHEEGCCPWRQADGDSFDCDGYTNAEAARTGHFAMCEKYARIKTDGQQGGAA